MIAEGVQGTVTRSEVVRDVC